MGGLAMNGSAAGAALPAPGRLSWSAALRMARREARSALPKFVFVVFAAAAGVGALTGVLGFSDSFRGMLLREARTLMAADLMVRAFDAASPEQEAALARLAGRGVRLTRITETVSMLSTDRAPAPVLVSVKAVDPAVYPFYGQVKLDPPVPLAEALTPEAVAVSEDLLVRLDARPGDEVRLGEAAFRIAAVVRLEPDRMTGSLNVGPRLMIHREGLERAALMRTGSRASQRFLLRLPPAGVDVEEARSLLKTAFPGALVTDFREVHPRIRRGLERATTFLSLVGLVAMIVGGLGVASAVHSHLQQRLDTIAVMKCLGARSSEIIRVYLLQTLLVGLAAGVAGVLLGAGVQAFFPVLIERYFPLRPERVYSASAAVQGLSIGLLVTVLFTLPALLAVREVRPAVIFRRDMAEAARPWRERWRRNRLPWAAGGVVVAGLWLIGAWLAEGDWRHAAGISALFLAFLAAGLAVLSLAAGLLLRGLRVVLGRTPLPLPAVLRHGIANLYRPGNHAGAVLVALGVGVMFLQTVYLVQHGLLGDILRGSPAGMPNVFLINITDSEREGVRQLLLRQEGRLGEPEIFASARARILSVNGVPISSVPLVEEWAQRYRRERTVTWLEQPPPNARIVAGAWWPAGNGNEPLLCIAEHAAAILGVKPGARIEWAAGGVPLRAAVTCVHREEEARFGPDLDFIFSPGSLEGMPVTYFGGVRMAPENVATLQRAAYREFPAVTVINAADVLSIIQEVIDQAAVVIRFVAAFTILAGVVVLASSVAGTRFRRIREAAILKTLGATRRRVMLIFSIEFLILGAAAGLLGALLAEGFAGVLLTRMLDAPWRFDWLPALAAVILSALIATATGWLTSFRVLGHKPLEVLRGE